MSAILSIGAAAMSAAHARAADAARVIAAAPAAADDGRDPLLQGALGLIGAEREAKAAAAIVRTADEITGTALDILS